MTAVLEAFSSKLKDTYNGVRTHGNAAAAFAPLSSATEMNSLNDDLLAGDGDDDDLVGGTDDVNVSLLGNDAERTGFEGENAVEIKDLEFWYGKSKVLKNLNLTIKKGQIYGLLGASGCGKTTILKLLLGRLIPHHGELRVLGDRPGTRGSAIPGSSVGYAPQETALYGELTIRENLQFHARMHGMSKVQYTQREKYLLDFLDLPPPNRVAGKLSGGQKRRVSLACALLHDPELLILDEPTVGVDPEVRARIWRYMREIARNGTTIIITTHYIDEAADGDCVGLMRGGMLLAEDNPRRLMKKMGHDSLEDVFLALCRRDTRVRGSSMRNVHSAALDLEDDGVIATEHDMPPVESKADVFHDENYSTRMGLQRKGGTNKELAQAVFIRKVLSLLKDYQTLVLAIVQPSIQICLFAVAIGTDPEHLSFAVVNQDVGFDYDVCALDNATLNCDNPGAYLRDVSTPLGQQYLDLIAAEYPDAFDLHFFDDSDAALASVEAGDAWGSMVIPPLFTMGILYRYDDPNYCVGPQLADVTAPTMLQVLQWSTVDVRMDQSNQQISSVITNDLSTAFVGLNIFFNNTAALGYPLVFDTPVYGDPNPKFLDFLAPGIVTVVCFAYSLILTSVSMSTERLSSALDRVLAAGARPIEIIVANEVAHFLVFFFQLSLLLFFTFVVFGIPLRGSVFTVALLGVVLGVAGMSLGLYIASGAKSVFEAVQISFASFFPTLLLSGILWPVQAIPMYLRWLSYLFPTTWVAEANRSVMIRGWGFSYSQVYMAFIVTGIWAVFIFIAATLAVDPPRSMQLFCRKKHPKGGD